MYGTTTPRSEVLTVKSKVEAAINRVADTIFAWPEVDSIAILDSELDTFDPYSLFSIDVYYSGSVPDDETRQKMFDYVIAFEPHGGRLKDRFLIGDNAFRVEYKSKERLSGLLAGDGAVVFRDGGSYALFRLKEARVLRSRSDWIDEIRLNLGKLQPGFWRTLRNVYQSRMEHCLNDMHAAVIHDDRIFFQLSLAGLLSNLSGTLFAINRRFEPSPRDLHRDLFELPLLPDAFPGSMDTLFQLEDNPHSRQREVAEYIVRRVIGL